MLEAFDVQNVVVEGLSESQPGRHTRRVRSRDRSRFGRYFFVLPVIVYVLAMFVYPLLYNISLSLRNYSIYSISTGKAPFVGVENYIHLFHEPLMWQTTKNTFFFVVGSIVFQVCIGMALAMFFNKKFPLNQILRTLILIPWLLPMIVSATSYKWIFDQSHGVLNWALLRLHVIQSPVGWLTSPHMSLLSVIINNIWIGVPFDIVLFYSGLQDIPAEYYEAAALDGCNAWQKFWYITVPELQPVIAIVLMLGLIYTLKVFDIVMVLTGGGPANSSQILSTWSYNLSFTELSFSDGAAVGNIMILVSLLFTVLYFKFSRDK